MSTSISYTAIMEYVSSPVVLEFRVTKASFVFEEFRSYSLIDISKTMR